VIDVGTRENEFMTLWHRDYGDQVHQALALGGREGRRKLKRLRRLFESKWKSAFRVVTHQR
jgi:hypothetical protein